MISMNYTLQQCTAVINGNATLTEVAFAIESAVSHFIGRGVARFECTRTKLPGGHCQLEFNALETTGPMVLSKVGSIGYAVRDGIFPATILPEKSFQVEDSIAQIVSDGQNRHGNMLSLAGQKVISDNTTSIIESFDFNPELPLSHLTYGLSDMFTGLFALNVRYIKWQGSMKKSQLFVRHNLTDEKLKKYLLDRVDYDIRQKVSTLVI